MKRTILPFLALLLIPSCAGSPSSQRALSGATQQATLAYRNPLQIPPFDDLKNRPGVKVSADGTSLQFPGGVTISDRGKFGVDNSGHGAVLCAWEEYLGVKKMTQLCASTGDKAFNARINKAIERINDFIVANSLSPITKGDLEQQAEALLGQVYPSPRGAAQKEAVHKECTTGDFIHIIATYKSISPEDFNHHVDDLLSVPRPPVTAPCL